MGGQAALTYLLCETANVHGGDKAHLERLIDVFDKLKYTRKGIKFQVFSPEGIALPDYEWFSVYKRICFEESTWREILSKANRCGDVWLDVFDPYGGTILKESLDNIVGVKLQASIVSNLEVREILKELDLSEKKLVLNVSGFDIGEIGEYVDEYTDLCGTLILQVGYQSYPTAVEDTGLQKIPVLRSAFPEVPLCFADHADAETEFAELVPVYAAIMGCGFVEKHFCVKRSESPYDSYSSVEPDQLERIGNRLLDAASANDGRFVSNAEAEYLEKSVQIPVLKTNAGSGALVGDSDVMYRRTSQQGLTFAQIVEIQQRRMVLGTDKPALSSIGRSDFKRARIGAVVAGRMKSSRLPNKAIVPIAGVSSVERCLEQCLGIRDIEEVILATSWLDEDTVLENCTLDGRARIFRGHPDDVISRYLGACEQYGVDVVIRVTADCPVVLPEILEYLLQKHFEGGADYTGADRCAVGTSGEIINVEALRRVIEYVGSADYSEYMTWYFRNNPDIFKVNVVSLPVELVRDYRLTLDYPEDLRMFEALFAHMKAGKSCKNAAEIFSVLDDNDDIARINQGMELKYVADKNLVETLNKRTRITTD